MKIRIYFTLGMIALQLGAFIVHYGFGLMLLGVMMLVSSFYEYNKEQKEEEE